MKHCSVPTASSSRDFSSSSACSKAHLELTYFTPLQNLRAILHGSNQKAFRIGEPYVSPIWPILELFPTSEGMFAPEEAGGSAGVGIHVAVAEQLRRDFGRTAQLMEHFIFPVKLIVPFNLATCIINRSTFLLYLLAWWRRAFPDCTAPIVASPNKIGGRRAGRAVGTRNGEIVFLEWYLASSPETAHGLLDVLRGRAPSAAQDRLLVDLNGNALSRRNEPLPRVLSRELEILVTVRRDITVAINGLFWQRVELIRPERAPASRLGVGNWRADATTTRTRTRMGTETRDRGLIDKAKEKERKRKKGKNRSGREKDGDNLRVMLGILSYEAFCLEEFELIDSDEE